MYTIKVIDDYGTHATTYNDEKQARKDFKESLKMIKEMQQYCPQDMIVLLRDDEQVLEEEYFWAVDEE